MKRIIAASFLFLLFGVHTSQAGMVCPETEYEEGYKSNLPTVDGKDIFQINSSLFPNGRVKCHITSYVTFKNNTRYRIEEGTYEGVKYRIFYTDGSGSVQGLPTNTLDYVGDTSGTNWSTQCRLDEMDDTHWCSIAKGDLLVGIWKDGTPFVTVGSSHYPYSNIVVRVDKNKPISASEKDGFTKAQSVEIIEQLKKGGSVLTRYQEWPYQSNKDKSIELFGFPQAWAILQKMHKSVKPQK